MECSNFQNGSAFEVVRLFKSMVSESCSANNYISSLVLMSCIKVGYFLLGSWIHVEIWISVPSLCDLYCMMWDMVGAVEVLVSVPQVDNCAYNRIKVGPGEKAYLDEALLS